MIKAVTVGLAVDVGGSLVAGIYIGLARTVVALASGNAQDFFSLSVSSHPAPPRITEFIVAAAFSLLGGYVAGRLHTPSPLRAGIYLGIATCVAAIPITLVAGVEAQGAAWVALSFVAAFVAATLGGAIAHLKGASNAA